METSRMRVTFCVTPQDTITDSIDLFEWRNDDWVFMRAASVTPVPLLHEAELAHLLREGKHDEIESHRYPEPSSAVVAYVDAGLKGMDWRRVSELHTWPIDQPMRPGSNPNRFADFDVQRGGCIHWLTKHFRGLNGLIVFAGLFVGFTSIRDPEASQAGWGPPWLGWVIILGSIALAYGIWQIVLEIEGERTIRKQQEVARKARRKAFKAMRRSRGYKR